MQTLVKVAVLLAVVQGALGMVLPPREFGTIGRRTSENAEAGEFSWASRLPTPYHKPEYHGEYLRYDGGGDDYYEDIDYEYRAEGDGAYVSRHDDDDDQTVKNSGGLTA